MPLPIGVPVIRSNGYDKGAQLSVETSRITNEPYREFEYQWFRANTTDPVSTYKIYVLQEDADLQNDISVAVTYTDTEGKSRTATSEPFRPPGRFLNPMPTLIKMVLPHQDFFIPGGAWSQSNQWRRDNVVTHFRIRRQRYQQMQCR